MDVGRPLQAASLDDLAHDSLDQWMVIRPPLYRNAGFDRDPFARHCGDDAPRRGCEAVDGKLRSFDRLLNDQVRAPARCFVERV